MERLKIVARTTTICVKAPLFGNTRKLRSELVVRARQQAANDAALGELIPTIEIHMDKYTHFRLLSYHGGPNEEFEELIVGILSEIHDEIRSIKAERLYEKELMEIASFTQED